MIAAWLIQGQLVYSGGSLPPTAVDALWALLVVVLAVLAGTGVCRLRYHLAHIRPDWVKQKSDVALAKHVAFFGVVILAGIVLATAVA